MDETNETGGSASKPGKTQWSLIVRARGSSPEARVALGALIRRYEGFVRMLICTHRYPPDSTAEELKQEYFARMLKYGDVEKLDRERGSFRAFLRRSVRNMLASEWRKWRAATWGRSSTDVADFESAHGATAELICDATFAMDTLSHVLTCQRDAAGDKARFDVLKRFLPGPELDMVALGPIAAALGTNAGQLRVEICRLRKGYRALLRAAVADTLALDPLDPGAADAIDRELRLMYRSLCEAPPAHVLVER